MRLVVALVEGCDRCGETGALLVALLMLQLSRMRGQRQQVLASVVWLAIFGFLKAANSMLQTQDKNNKLTDAPAGGFRWTKLR